ncbi:MAG TPA: DoxX family protein [Casimicrobiaceae bacterium]|nr:DoxX family protein [Casimicrobiaceae bacterium]
MRLHERLFAAWAPRLLSVLRIVTALLFMSHGTAKLLHVPALPQFAALVPGSLSWIAGALELIGGALLAAGLFSRATAFVLSGEMAFAYFLSHARRGLLPISNGGELAALYCFVFLYLWVAGPGPWSLDARWRR